MDNLLNLIIAALGITLVDIDNAVYSSSQVGTLKTHRRMALVLLLGLEFIGRLFLLALFAILTNEQEPLFIIFGVEITIETLALLLAGSYLLISNGQEFVGRLRSREDETTAAAEQGQNFVSFLIKTSLVLTLMSVDTVLVISSQVTTLGVALFLLIFSAVLRLFFVDWLVIFIARYPAVEVFVIVLLMAIGTELIVQGLGYDFEAIFNLLLILTILIFIGLQRRKRENTS